MRFSHPWPFVLHAALALVAVSPCSVAAWAEGVPGAAGPQKPTPASSEPRALNQDLVLRAETRVVLVDVRVWDKGGQPVTDLEQKDFAVYEDGVPQTITSFSFENIEALDELTEEVSPPPTVELGKQLESAVPYESFRNRRLIVLFFDLTSLAVLDVLRAVDAATSFVRSGMTSADLVAMVTYGYGLKVAQTFTNDRDALLRALQALRPGESLPLGEAGAPGDAGTTGLGDELVAQDLSAAFTPDETEFNIFNTDQKLAAIESLARMLRDVPGRKAVLHFSSGIERTGVENQAQLRATVDAANQSNVSLYTMDARGLLALPPGGDVTAASPRGTAIYTGAAMLSQVSSMHGSRETLATLATDTGGRTFYDLNDFTQVFERVQKENTSYYLLGYTPSNMRSDGRFRRIRVQVRRQGLKVQARPGYFAPKDFRQFTREDKELQLQQALEFDMPFVELPFAVEAAHFFRQDKDYFVVLAAKIPGSSVSLLKASAVLETEFDFVWRVCDTNGRPVQLLRDTLPVKLRREALDEVLASNFLYQGGMVLPPGQYQLKVVVRENQSGRLGTFEQPFVLPEITRAGLAVSSVVVSNQVQKLESLRSRQRVRKKQPENPLEFGGVSVQPSVTRVFRTDQNLYVYLETYADKPARGPSQANATPEGPPRAPSVAVVFFRGGVEVSEAGPFVGKLEELAGGKATYYLQIPLERFPLGRYLMQVNVLDHWAGRVAFARVPLAVVRPPRASIPAPGH